MSLPFLSLVIVQQHVAEMEARGVSQVSRSPGGFIEAYTDADGDPARLPPWWHARRAAYVARMYAQVLRRDEPLRCPNGTLTRRHLSFIAWAWSPDRSLYEPPPQTRAQTHRRTRSTAREGSELHRQRR